MTTIYLINNSLTMNVFFPLNKLFREKREKRLLSIEGEKESKMLADIPYLNKVSSIYTSSYVMSIGTAKYLAKKLEVEMQVCEELGERVIGNLGDKKIRMIQELQENDFSYKLSGGESLDEVRERMLRFLRKVLIKNDDKTVAFFTHNVAITCLLSKWCSKGFNLDNRLILNYQDKAIVDGAWDGISIIELVFQGNELVSIERKK